MNQPELTPQEACALEWCLRRQQADWSDADAAQLQAWLDASPLHTVAFLRVEQGWNRVEQSLPLIERRPASRFNAVSRTDTARPRSAPRARTWLMAWAASLAMLLVGGAATVALLVWEPPGQYTTAVGSHRTVVLADGSRIELNTDTRIRASFQDDTRRVDLIRGEAYFDVRPDAARPFIVQVDDQRVVVLGTRFAVRRDAQRMRVVVTHGKVRVDPAIKRADAKPAPPVIAVRGDTVNVDQRSALRVKLPDTKLDSELAWRTGFLMFDDVPLSKVAAEFNRYNRRKLMVTDGATADIRISGSFESSNLDAFIRLLQQVHELRVDVQGDRVRVSS